MRLFQGFQFLSLGVDVDDLQDFAWICYADDLVVHASGLSVFVSLHMHALLFISGLSTAFTWSAILQPLGERNLAGHTAQSLSLSNQEKQQKDLITILRLSKKMYLTN